MTTFSLEPDSLPRQVGHDVPSAGIYDIRFAFLAGSSSTKPPYGSIRSHPGYSVTFQLSPASGAPIAPTGEVRLRVILIVHGLARVPLNDNRTFSVTPANWYGAQGMRCCRLDAWKTIVLPSAPQSASGRVRIDLAFMPLGQVTLHKQVRLEIPLLP